jgi:N-acyl homoserine lactone hydrolase
MKMHMLSGGRLRMRRGIYYPGAEKTETFELPVSCALFKHPQGNVLYDTGCHPDAAANPEARWGSTARITVPIFQPEDAVVHQLPKVGLTADDIDVVVCSHMHIDHCGCNVFFKNATVVCHARELEAARAADSESKGYMRIDWDHPQRFECIEAQHDLFGDGRLTLLPAPGHTPGSVIVHAVLDKDGPFLLVSDAIPVQACLEQRYCPKVTWDVDKSMIVFEEVARLQKDGATVLFGHDDAQWQGLRKGAEFYA